MKHALLAAACATAVALAFQPIRAGAFSGIDVGSGQINRGYDEKVPSSSKPRPIPTLAEARAAKLMPDNGQPSAGPQQSAAIPPGGTMSKETRDGQATAGGPQAVSSAADAMQNGAHDSASNQPQLATSGSASRDSAAAQGPAGQGGAAQGPIGATGQTMPSLFSKRNDILDRVPIMAQPSTLSDEQRQQIYHAVMADKTPAANDAGTLAPAGMLDTSQALNETHPLPPAVGDIPGVKRLSYVKTRNKVFLVEPNTRIVVEEIGS